MQVTWLHERPRWDRHFNPVSNQIPTSGSTTETNEYFQGVGMQAGAIAVIGAIILIVLLVGYVIACCRCGCRCIIKWFCCCFRRRTRDGREENLLDEFNADEDNDGVGEVIAVNGLTKRKLRKVRPGAKCA